MQPDALPEIAQPVAPPIPNLPADADVPETAVRLARYARPEFTRALLEHMYKAKQMAIAESAETK